MSPGLVRMLAVACGSMLVGVVLGSYATRALIGSSGTAPVRPGALVAAPPPPPPECNCDEIAAAPGTPAAPIGATARLADELTEVEAPPLPGLPRSALNMARAATERQLRPCTTSTAGLGDGTLVLTLTVTAMGGEGFIRDAEVTAQSGDVIDAETCVLERAREVRFEWTASEGQQTLKLPIRIGG